MPAVSVLLLCFSFKSFGCFAYKNFMSIMLIFYCAFFARSEKAASCLLPNTCLGIATLIIAKFESIEVGLTWDRVSTSPSPDDNFSFSWVLGMLVIQSLIFGVITWYVHLINKNVSIISNTLHLSCGILVN